jgi:hypothetical protein
VRPLLLGLAALAGCGSATGGATSTSGGEGIPVIVGATSREEIEATLPAWAEEAARQDVEDETARSLAAVPPGARVDVYLGTWCGDSRRVVSRFFRALELVPEPRPFAIRFIGVDRARSAPGFTEGVDLRYVPTFVVRRDGAEVGRVVESAPRGIERELVDLLTGATHGVITSRTDL